MFALFFFAAAIAVSYGLPLDSQAQTHGGRIVGGKSTTIDKYPHQIIFENSLDQKLRCGGSIISKNVVLTAGHCVDGLTSSQYKKYKIRSGTSYPKKGGSLHKITKIILHEDYDRYSISNDVALIFVNPPFEFNSNEKAINLNNSTKELKDNTPVTITGFGTLRSNGPLPKQLQVVSLPYVNKNQCNNAYTYYGGIEDGKICAGDLGIGGKDSCQGDSGGPLVINDQLIGIVSYGIGCAEPNYPGVYTEVAYFYDWIVKNAGLDH